MISIDKLTSYCIVPLSVLAVVASNTIFGLAQHFIEFVLLLIFVALISTYKLSKSEWLLLSIFILAQIGSFFINPLPIFLVNAKQFGLAIFSLIHFRRYGFKSIFLHIIFLMCAFLVLFENFFGSLPINISLYLSTMSDSYGSRPLGLFLNYHYSSFFIATYLIGYTAKRTLFLFDYYLLWIINVKTNLLSYFASKFLSLLQEKVKFLGSKFGTNLLYVVSLLIIIISVTTLLEFFRSINFGYNSVYVILYQALDPKSYIDAIYIFPNDVVKHLQEKTLFDFTELDSGVVFLNHGSELGIVSFLVQGGVFLTFCYFILLFKSFKIYRVFIFFTLFHYSFILSPFIIYIMSVFEPDDNTNNK